MLEIFGQYYLAEGSEPSATAELSHGLMMTEGGLAIPVTLKRALEESEAQIELLRREAGYGVLFEHDRVVRILDFGSHRGRTYLATQRVLGRSLKGVIRQIVTVDEKPDPSAWMLAALVVLDALESIHRRGFVHRDVCPENILIGFDGSVRLGGCGYAVASGEEGPVPQNRCASPEQLAGADVDQRSDIYSVGLCLRDLLRLSDMAPRMMHAIERVIERAVASKLEARHPTAASFKEELSRLLDDFDPSLIARAMAQLFPNQAEKERRKLDELTERALADRSEPPPSREISVRVVPIYPDPEELAEPLAEPEPQSPWSRRIAALSFFLLAIPILAYASSSEENMENAGRYLRYAVLGQKPGGSLTIESVPSGARLFLDGADSGKTTPITIASLESEVVHRVRLQLEGEEPETSTVSIGAGERRSMTVLISSAMVDLRVTSEPPGAEVSINGRAAAFTPCSVPVRAGQPVELRISKVGYRDHEQRIEPAKKQPFDLTVTLEKTEELLAAEAEEAELQKELKRGTPKKKKRGRKVSSKKRSKTDEGR